MKKILLFAFGLLASASLAPAQTHVQTFSFNDQGLGGGTATSGTYLPNDTFSFDVFLTFAGYDCYAYDLWLETQTLNNFASSLSVTGLTYGPAFTDPIQLTPNPAPFDVIQGANPGFLTEARSLGALAPGEGASFLPIPEGNYLVAHISFAIQGATPGTFILRSTTFFGRRCIAVSRDETGHFIDNPIPAEEYTITIIPEPGTISLLGVGFLGLAALFRRSKPRK